MHLENNRKTLFFDKLSYDYPGEHDGIVGSQIGSKPEGILAVNKNGTPIFGKGGFMGNYYEWVIEQTISKIKRSGQIPPDLDDLDLEDKKTYELISSGDTDGIFNCQRSDEKSYFRIANLDKFSDLVSFTALNRPGPIAQDFILDFIDNKNKTNYFDFSDRRNLRRIIDYKELSLESILHETYGLILFREQINEITKKVASFDEKMGATFIKNLNKRIHKVVEKDRNHFFENALNNGFSEEQIIKIYDWIKYYVGFTANKKFIKKVALITYKMAYLKAHYPNEFAVANEIDNEEISIYRR